MSKGAGLLLLVFLAVSSLIMVEIEPASGYIKPSIPEFTVKFETHPYYVPPVYSIDPYTGANVTTRAGYWVENKSVVFTIKNQPFTPYNDTNGNYITLSYNIRGKGHFEPTWTTFGNWQGAHYDATDSEYLEVSFPYGDTLLARVPIGGQVDFQVDARVGYYTLNMVECREEFTGETSGWSPTLTITIGENQTPTPSPGTTPTPTPTPTGEPQQTELTNIILAVAIIAIVAGSGLGLLIYLAKKK